MWHSLSLALKSGLVSLLLGAMVLPAEAAESSQAAVWTPRKLHFVYMGFTTHYSCDGLRDNVKSALLQLGARPIDLHVQEAGCTRADGGPEPFPGVEATFSVLAPAASAQGEGAASASVKAHWESVELNLDRDSLEQAGQCELLEQIKKEILPLFATRSVEFTDSCFPHELTLGVRLRLQVLKPLPADSPGEGKM